MQEKMSILSIILVCMDLR